jgi:hypothetical protein
MTKFPSLSDLFAEYEFLCRALVVAGVEARDDPTRVELIAADDVEQRFSAARQELDHAFTLTLVASVEAAVRWHYEDCLDLGKPSWFAVPANALRKRVEDGSPRFEDVLDLWKLDPDGRQDKDIGRAIGKLKQLYKRRHWLAHGRYWNDHSGFLTADPYAVMNVADELRDALPEFPVR